MSEELLWVRVSFDAPGAPAREVGVLADSMSDVVWVARETGWLVGETPEGKGWACPAQVIRELKAL